MQHTIAAVFDRQSQAEQALDDLVACGFSRDNVRLSQSEAGVTDTEAGQDHTSTFGASIKSFFSDIFGGASHPDTELYSEAVQRGNYVLTVDVTDDDMVERATEALERHAPLNIDEAAVQWRGADPSLLRGTAAGQQSAQSSMQSAQAQTQAQGGATAIPVIEEALKVGKREIQRGGVRIYRRVLEKPAQESVNLRAERVTVRREAVDQPASAADLAAFQEGSFEVRETAEEPVVEKVARVVEQVVVGKEVSQHREQVSDTVRRTEVEVEPLSGAAGRTGDLDDDAYFRQDWRANFAGAGGSYDDYAPAYRYGAALGERYKGRRWDDIESDVRRGWESQNAGSAWDKMKNAVRRGWERMTS